MERKHRFRDLWRRKAEEQVDGPDHSNEFPRLAIPPSNSGGPQTKNSSPRSSHHQDTPGNHGSQTQRRSRQSSLVALARPLRSPTSLAQLAPYDRSLVDKSRRDGVDANLGDEFAHMTLGGDDRLMTEPSKKRYSEDVAERNLDDSWRQRRASDARGRSIDVLDHGLPGYPRVANANQRYSQDVADRNMSAASSTSQSSHPSQRPASKPPETSQQLHRLAPGPRRSDGDVNGGDYTSWPTLVEDSLTISHVDKDDDRDQVLAAVSQESNKEEARRRSQSGPTEDNITDSGSCPTSGSREDCDPAKLRPAQGPITSRTDEKQESAAKPERAAPTDKAGSQLVKDTAIKHPHARAQLRSKGFNLQDTVDIDVQKTEAPAVVHEVVQPLEREVRHEQITREVHEHDVIHRILPIVDVEVKPARHFMRSANGTLTEIPAPRFSGAEDGLQSWPLVETSSSLAA